MLGLRLTDDRGSAGPHTEARRELESALELFQGGVEVAPAARWAVQGVNSTQIELDSMVIPASMILSTYFCQSASFRSFS